MLGPAWPASAHREAGPVAALLGGHRAAGTVRGGWGEGAGRGARASVDTDRVDDCPGATLIAYTQ
jgi:hypothetical protein